MNSPATAPAADEKGSRSTPSAAPASRWDPLPASEWNADAARHLLRRVGWTAKPEDVETALQQGLPATLARLFPAKAIPFPKPKMVAEIEAEEPGMHERIRAAAEPEKRQLRKEMRDRAQQGYQDLTIRWLQFAADPAHSAAEKWVLFLSDVYVVAFEKVHNPALLYQHHAILRERALGAAPALTKAVSRSPAMIDYLDLRESKKQAPNENFARELFELFLLGEGNYTETDIKEAARAFTGYRHRFGEFQFARGQHDPTPKKIFGKTAPYDGDGAIDLAYQQPAAGTFLPGEMLRFYLSEQPVPRNQIAELGRWWQGTHYNLRALLHRIFGSQLFFSPEYRGAMIKSPIQFYLGLVQDLSLDVPPLPRQAVGLLRQMGQMPFNPPNVRGWMGGRSWINSSTLAARRQLVQALFNPINEVNLNADEVMALDAARSEGRSRFTVSPDRVRDFAVASPQDAADRLVRAFLAPAATATYAGPLAKFVAGKSGETSPERVRAALLTLLDSPEYQLS
ncbi:DUF1800 domain-containing protein [Opitutaceae bacterium EW11]|nr:DUF1800 domain-containing protein [Opitutaceae bacterium EW11]